MIDNDLMHPDDADHNAAKAAFQGKVNYGTGEFIKKLGPLDDPSDAVLKRAVGRINHPYYPYPKPWGEKDMYKPIYHIYLIIFIINRTWLFL